MMWRQEQESGGGVESGGGEGSGGGQSHAGVRLESGGDEGIRGNGNDSNGGGCRVFKDQHFRTDDDIGGAGGSSIAGI